MTALLELTDIRRQYLSGGEPVDVLKGVTLSINAGEMVATFQRSTVTSWRNCVASISVLSSSATTCCRT